MDTIFELLSDDEALRVRARLKSMETTPIALLVDGCDAKIRGRLRMSGVGFVTPIKQRPCAVYCLEITVTAATGGPGLDGHGPGGGRSKMTIFQSSESPPELCGSDFAVEDDTGIANVRIRGARVVFAAGLWQWKSEYESARAAFLLARVGKVDRRRSLMVDYRERAFVEGEVVTIVGRPSPDWKAAEEISGSHPYRDTRLLQRRLLAGTDVAPVYIFQKGADRVHWWEK